MGWYHTALICLNGHVITDRLGSGPDSASKFCKKCGAATVSKCQGCNTGIQGDYEVEGVAVIGFGMRSAPKFCHNCGKPYPWTAARIEAAKTLADEIDELSESEKLLLKSSIDDIVTDSPKTDVGIVRFKKYASKGGEERGAMLPERRV